MTRMKLDRFKKSDSLPLVCREGPGVVLDDFVVVPVVASVVIGADVLESTMERVERN